jgi:methionine-rich copper-binding protein CopC
MAEEEKTSPQIDTQENAESSPEAQVLDQAVEAAKEAFQDAQADNSAESHNMAAQSAHDKAVQNGASEAQAKQIADIVRETFRDLPPGATPGQISSSADKVTKTVQTAFQPDEPSIQPLQNVTGDKTASTADLFTPEAVPTTQNSSNEPSTWTPESQGQSLAAIDHAVTPMFTFNSSERTIEINSSYIQASEPKEQSIEDAVTPKILFNASEQKIEINRETIQGTEEIEEKQGTEEFEEEQENTDSDEVDTLPPTATITMADTTLKAGETTTVSITFSEVVTGFDNSDLAIAGGSLTDVSSSDGGTTWTATLTPTADTEDASNLTSLDNAGVTDAAGNTGIGTTDSDNYTVDTLLPTVTTFSPADDATEITVTDNLLINFSESVSLGSGHISLYKTSGDTLVETFDVSTSNLLAFGTVTNSNDYLSINPTADLDGSTEYYVQIDTTAIEDTAGNNYAGVTNETDWSFTTEWVFSGDSSVVVFDLVNGVSSSHSDRTFDADVTYDIYILVDVPIRLPQEVVK